jgi:CysZ protein
MELIDGIRYNYDGLKLGLKTPSLLVLGLLRFVILIIFAIIAVWLVLANYQEIMNVLWKRPESLWILWLWHVVSWLLAALLAGVSTIIAFLISQVLFSVLLMDRMSQITEQIMTGKVANPSDASWFRTFIFLIRQEIPRTAIPVLIAIVFMVIGWFTPLSPISTLFSSLAAAIFLAWDNTDLVPARRLEKFSSRFRLLTGHFLFHLGFGLWFLLPVFNILFLSFAPVGGTRYYIERLDKNGKLK